MIRHKPLALAAFAAVLLLMALAAATAPAAAQTETNTTETTVQDTERIDQNTVLIDSAYDADSGTATVTIRSKTLQQVVVTDAGKLMQGGDIPQRSAMLKPGETATIEIPATEVRGMVALSIATSETLYGEPIEVGQGSLFKGPATWGTAQVAGAAGFSGGVGIVALVAWRRVRGGKQEVEQVV